MMPHMVTSALRRHLFRLLALPALLALTACCDNEIHIVAPSPDGARKAVVFMRNCGATTGFNTQVSIIPAHMASPRDKGNVLVVDGRHTLRLRWHGNDALEIGGYGSARVFRQTATAAGVRLHFVP